MTIVTKYVKTKKVKHNKKKKTRGSIKNVK